MYQSVSNPFTDNLANCNFCKRLCGVNRFGGQRGYCNCGTEPLVASICIHKGEEPILSGESGVCNVFFGHCNMACIYCQNHQITWNSSNTSSWLNSYNLITEAITKILDSGINHLGFVSPTHQLFQMYEIVNRVRSKGYNPTVIYNTNCFDNPLVLKELENTVDIYLPDIKYFSDELSNKYSDTDYYFRSAIVALKEMVRQKGTSIVLSDDGLATSGVIVRHLVIPGHTDDSKRVLEKIAEIISPNIHISLMSQYYPTENVKKHNILSNTVSYSEYEGVKDLMYSLGFTRGWVQEMESSNHYIPDFNKSLPFTV